MAKFKELKKYDELKYIDVRPIYLPVLTAYKNGLTPKRGEVIQVTANEKIKLLKQKNGRNPVWEEVKQNKTVSKADKLNLDDGEF